MRWPERVANLSQPKATALLGKQESRAILGRTRTRQLVRVRVRFRVRWWLLLLAVLHVLCIIYGSFCLGFWRPTDQPRGSPISIINKTLCRRREENWTNLWCNCFCFSHLLWRVRVRVFPLGKCLETHGLPRCVCGWDFAERFFNINWN